MPVAVKQVPEKTSAWRVNRLAVGSLVGAVFVLASLALIFHGLSYLWWDVLGSKDVLNLDDTSFVNWTFLILLMVAVAAGLGFVGIRLMGPNPPHGLRAGIFVGIVALFLLGLVIQGIGIQIESRIDGGLVGLIVWGVVSAVLLFFVLRAFFRPGFGQWLGRLEDQGWFTAAPYKGSQGLRVRRGTIVGLLALAGCGIYTLLTRNRAGLAGDWTLDIPFVQGGELILLPYRIYTLTLLLAIGSLWFAWRVVNYPAFADFLIATEAEMNKVSWTTRKRLVQDTIVVLTTVLLMTLFLLLVDVLWFKILSNPLIHVLRVDTTAQQTSGGSEKPEY